MSHSRRNGSSGLMIDQAAATLDAEAGGAATVLDRLDDALAKRSLFDRISRLLEEVDAKSVDRDRRRTKTG